MHPQPFRSFAAIFSLLAAAAAPAAEIPWTEKVQAAFDESRSSGKPVFVDVWATWCVPCKEMDQTTYRDPAVVAAMASFVPLKVDQDSSENFCERHSVEALPLVLFLDGTGAELGRRAGLQQSDELLEAMKAVGSGYAEYLEASPKAEKDPDAAEATAEYLLGAGNSERAVTLLRRAVESAPAERADALSLRLGEALLRAEDPKGAGGVFKRLSESAAAAETRGRALDGLSRSLYDRGREAEAAEVFRQLQREFPDLAKTLAPPG